MKTTVSLSVITLTKNRANLLAKCLSSLEGQLSASDELIVVDNCSTDSTQRVIQRFQQSFVMHPYKSILTGYPNLYNFAASHCSKKLLVFFDDDCIASPGYTARIREKYETHTDFVLQGKTLSLPKNNVYAEISQDHLSNWMEGSAQNGNLSVIDNRNVVIPRAIFKILGGFSSKMKIGSEDVELGMRLVESGVPIVYDSKMLAYHHERTTLRAFLSQHGRIANSHSVLDLTLIRTQRISLINTRTWKLHIRSFWAHESRLWKENRLMDMGFLPLIYILLLIMRVLGYLRLIK